MGIALGGHGSWRPDAELKEMTVRRYTLSVNDNPYEIDVEEISATDFQVQIDGQLVEVSLVEQSDAADAQITPALSAGASMTVPVPKAPRVPKEMKAAPRTPSPAVAGGTDLAYSMSAPMPGVILTINVGPGDQVAKGDVVMILEAMKMKNELHASQNGIVASVDVKPNDQVKYGQVLLRFEKD